MRLPLILAVLGSCAMAAAGPALAAEKKPRLVVLSIRPVDDSTAKTAASLTEILTTELSRTARFEVTGESELTSMMGFEQKKQLLGCADESCLAELGGALGCDYLLLGAMGKVGNKLRLDLKLADVKKTRIVARDGVTVSSAEELIAAGQTTLLGVLALLDGKPLPAPAVAAPVAAEVRKAEGPGPGPYLLMGVGGAALLAGGALAGITVASKADNRYSQNELQLGAGFVTSGIGAAALLAGVIWAIAAPSPSPSPSATSVGLAPTAGGAALFASGSF